MNNRFLAGRKEKQVTKINYNCASNVELVKSGDDFFEKVIAIIHHSKKLLHLQTYIFADDATGMAVIKALTGAVKRGVKVYLLVDAFGSHELKSETINFIKENGINFRTYSPLFTGARLKFGRRLHHKILVSDETEALIGGTNIDDKYHLKGKGTPWLDYAVYVKGNICFEISNTCERLWKVKRGNRSHKPLAISHQPITVKLQQNDWLYGKKGISRSLNNSVRHAKSEVILMASYFLPGGKIRRSLRNASKRKVSVKIILPGLSDINLVKHATKYWYAWMLRNNFEIYEWAQTILHGKVMKVDNNWVSIGSYNINHLSHYSSIETNLEVYDEYFSRKVEKEMENVLADCTKITNSEYLETMNNFEKFICWSSFQIVRFLFGLQFRVLSKE